MTLSPKRWQVAPPAPPSHLAHFSHLHPVIVQTLYNRGVTDPDSTHAFLSKESNTTNPFDLQGMHTAVTRLRQALRADESIVVYGDFDADGVTATALLVQTLQAFGSRVQAYIPHRVNEGYGLHKKALADLARDDANLIITVDCGIRGLEQIAYANQLGLDVIVTDHHSVGKNLPQAVAAINPKQDNSHYPFDELAGVGVAYKLAQALLRSHRQMPVGAHKVDLAEEDLLDLVALGTVADMVPLLGENRTLVHRGLECLNRMERPGIKALCQQARVKAGKVNAGTIGYVLGPRINAAGRMKHARKAFQLLNTRSLSEAGELASQLGQLNRQRQSVTRETHERARQLALEAKGRPYLFFAAAAEFSAGIVGLAASRLVDEFYRPAAVAEMGDEISRGSCRSIPEFNIVQALDKCEDLLIHHGGHAAAAGFTVPNKHLEELIDKLQYLAEEQLSELELTPALSVDAEIELSQISWDLRRELDQLEPCGYANPQPLFLSRNVRPQRQRTVGRNDGHLKLKLSHNNVAWDAIAFRQGEWVGNLTDRVDVVYHLKVNEWRGRRQLQLNVQDIRPAGMDDTAACLQFNQDKAESKETG